MGKRSAKEEQILKDVEYFKDKYFAYDLPVPFVGGLMLYPVTVRNYNEFLASSNCLTLNKNDDIKGLKMTHLKYLLSKMEDKEEGQIWCYKFTKIVELCLHIPSGFVCPKCGARMDYQEFYRKAQSGKYTPETIYQCTNESCDGRMIETIGYRVDPESKKTILMLNGVDIDNDNFQKMRRYIMYQNLPDFKDDSFVNKEIREDQAKARELRNKDSGTASLERQMLCVVAKSSYKVEEIYDMTMRKFIMLLGIINDAIEYQITKTGLSSGFVTLPKGETIEHWIYKKEEGLYGKAVDADAYSSKIKNAAG